jgi:hypothetical protein
MPRLHCPTPDHSKGWLPEMRCVRALPITQLMLAAGSLSAPVATALLGGLPGKNERPHFLTCPHAGHPINHHVAGPRPWTQIRLGAGTRNVVSRTTFPHGRHQMT